MRMSTLRSPLGALASLALVACVSSPADDLGGSAGGGGKADSDEAWAERCPVEGDRPDLRQYAIAISIQDADSCASAAGLAYACAIGDWSNGFASEAITVCERGFHWLIFDRAVGYDQLIQRCVEKYAEISEYDGEVRITGPGRFCQLEVTRLYNHLYPGPMPNGGRVSYTPTCPVDGATSVDASPTETILAAIAESPSCGQAANTAQACALGADVDLQLAATARTSCEPALDQLPAAEAALHRTLLDECAAKAGPDAVKIMYCQLQVDEVFAQLYAQAE